MTARVVTASIRAAALHDSPELADLTTQLGYPVETAELRDRLERLLGRSDEVVLVAVDSRDRPIGWIHVAILDLLEHSDYAAINGLVVDERVRGTGIGRASLPPLPFDSDAMRLRCGSKSSVGSDLPTSPSAANRTSS